MGRVADKPRAITQHFLNRFRRIAARLASALTLLKSENIVHTDIKPENIFFKWRSQREALSSIEESESMRFPAKRKAAGGRDASSARAPLSLESLPPEDFDVALGDFGNSFHISEVANFYGDFDVQSLPYRSPEVLMGVPFGCQADIWSLGVVLVELILGKTLFHSRSREELFLDMSATLSPPHMLRFSGGKFTQTLFPLLTDAGGLVGSPSDTAFTEAPAESKSSGDLDPSASCNYNDHLRRIYCLLSPRFDSSLSCPPDLLHFLAGMLHPDPDLRLCGVDLLTHDFLARDVPVPRVLLTNTSKSKPSARRASLQTLGCVSK